MRLLSENRTTHPTPRSTTPRRTRWGSAAVLAALVLGVSVGGESAVVADVSSGDRPVFVPITPCRLADTRPAPNNVQVPAAPIAAGATLDVIAQGSNGRCVGASAIPSDAVALSMNVTALRATTQTFLTIWGDGDNPGTASLNPAPGQPPTPNAVQTPLAADGTFRVYNDSGTVDVVIDVNGYYAHHDHDDRYLTEAEVEAEIIDYFAGQVPPPVMSQLPVVDETGLGPPCQLDDTDTTGVFTTCGPILFPAVLDPIGYVVSGTARIGWWSVGGPSSGECAVFADETMMMSTVTRYGETIDTTDFSNSISWITIPFVFEPDPLSAGPNALTIRCREITGDMDWTSGQLTATIFREPIDTSF